MKPLRFYYTLGVKRGHLSLAALYITTRTKKRPWFIAYHYPERLFWRKMCYDGRMGPAVGCARMIVWRMVTNGF